MTFVQTLPVQNLAIIGMEAVWAGCENLDAFEQLIYRAQAQTEPVTVTNIEALLASTARSALLDAGITPGAGDVRAVLMLAHGQASGRYHQTSKAWEWASQVVDLSGENNPLVTALQQAGELLSNGQADIVVFAAGSDGLHVSPETPLSQQIGFGFDRAVHGLRLGQGAGAVVLMRRDTALSEGRCLYASFLAGTSASGTVENNAALPVAPVLNDVKACCASALEQADLLSRQIGYVETFASGLDALDAIEIAGLAQTYRQPGQEMTTALGSAQTSTGYLGAAAGLASLIRTALCLYRRIIPGTPGWSAPKLPALWRGAPFYVAADSRAWFEPSEGAGRLAGLNLMGTGGSFAHLILSEPEACSRQVSRPIQALVNGDGFLFALAGDSQDDLMRDLQALRQTVSFASQPARLAAEWFDRVREQAAHAHYGLAIVGRDLAEIAREIDLALNALPQAFEKGVEWQTPLGSSFSPQPVGRLGTSALVYPGAFNSYPGVGQDLFRLFPALFDRMARVTTDIGGVLRERLLYPRSLTAISKEEMEARETALLSDPVAMLNSGTALSVMYTHILREIFKLQPSSAFGYSLGETSMMYAAGVWTQGDQAAARLAGSEVFRARLAGPQNAIRAYWGLPQTDQPAGPEAPLWSNYLVMAAPERVAPALENEPRVYLTHINTPRQVVIGGDPEACRRVIQSLRCSALKAPFDYALHCEPMRSEFDALVDLHDWQVEQASGLNMYTAADYGMLPTPYEHGSISKKIAHMLTSPLDFPRLIRQVYDGGARVFIEAGAGSNCARWIDETLKGQPHLAISMNRRGTDDHSNLVRTLARLHAHRVPVDLSPLYQPVLEKVNA